LVLKDLQEIKVLVEQRELVETMAILDHREKLVQEV